MTTSRKRPGQPYAPGVKEYLTLAEAAEQLGKDQAEVYQLVRGGELYGLKTEAGDWLVTVLNVQAYRAGRPQTLAVP